MNNKKGAFPLFALPMLSIGAIIIIGIVILAIIFGIGVFFNKFFLALIFTLVIFFAFKYKAIGKKQVILVIGLVFVALLVFQLLGLFMLVPSLGISNPIYEDNEIRIDGFFDRAITLEAEGEVPYSKMLAPQTYRRLNIKITNKQPEMPYVLTRSGICVVLGDCKDEYKDKGICKYASKSAVKERPDFTVAGGFLLGFWDEIKDAFSRELVGVSKDNPKDWVKLFNIGEFTDRQVSTCKFMTEMHRKDGEEFEPKDLVLWSASACRSMGDEYTQDMLDGCDVKSSIELYGVGYVYAMQGAKTGRYPLNIWLAQERQATFGETITDIVTFRWVLGVHHVMLVDYDKDYITVMTPSIQILLILAGIGIILGFGFYLKLFKK